MNKPLAVGLGVVALAAAAYVGTAAYVGGRVQTELLAQQTKFSEQLPFIKIADHKYEKGLFSSTRTLTVQFGCDATTPAEGEEASKPVLITLRDHISHGPLAGGQFGAALIETELDLPPEVRKTLTQLFGDKKPFTVRTLVGFSGGYTSDFVSPEIQFKGPQGEQFAWKGVTASFTTDSAGSFVNYKVSAPGLEVNDPAKNAKMLVNNISWHGESRPVNGSMWLMVGKDEGEIGSIEFAAPPLAQKTAEGTAGEPFKFSFDKLKFVSNTSVDKDLLNSKMTMTGTGMIAGTKLDKLEMEASLKRLHAPTYQRIMAGFMKAAGTACDKPAQEADPADMLAGMQNDLLALLPYNPEYALDKLAVEYAGQRGELSYSVGMEGVTDADLKTPAMMLLMGKGVVKADIKLPVSWIEQIAAKAPTQTAALEPGMVGMMLDQFAQQGFIVRQGAHVAASMRLEKGAMLLNGKPMPMGLPSAALGAGDDAEEADLGEAEEEAEEAAPAR